MMRYIFIPLMLVFVLALGACSGSSVTVDEPTGETTINKPSADKVSSAYIDPIPDVYMDTDLSEWCMIFDYGDPVQDMDYHYADAEMVEVDTGEWYMYYTLTDAAPDGWLFLDAAVEIRDVGDEPFDPDKDWRAGKYEFKWDFERIEANMLTEVWLPLAYTDKKGKITGWWVPSDDFDIAIHATIGIWGTTVSEDTDGDGIDDYFEYGIVDDETGWGTNCSKAFPIPWKGYWGNRWGGWTGSIAPATPPVFDPVMNKGYRAWHFGPYSYWRVRFAAQDWYPFPGSNDWVGWCTDPRTMSPGSLYYVDVYSCYDPNLPTLAQSNNWDLISYMITMRNKGESPYNVDWTNNTNKQHFQNAVWYFKYGSGGAAKPGGLGGTIADDAIANGENFVPGSGEYYAVILFPRWGFQMNIIEVDP
jgi:hypothetical protein